MSLPLDVAAGAVAGGTSILYAALGETVSERAGIINLGTEGCMLVGALTGYAVAAMSANPWVGAIAGAGAGGALAALHAILVIERKASQLASGLVMLFLALGITSLFGGSFVSRTIHSFGPIAIPGLSKIPGIGRVLFDHDALTYLSFFMAPAIWWLLFRSRWGLLIRGAGERGEVLAAYGYSPKRIQYVAVIAGGALAGLGGAQLSTAYANSWFEAMTAGRGFIAVALVIFAGWDPLKAVAGAYLFGAALALSPALQARGYNLNQFALDALPYVITVLVLIVLSRKRLHAAPEGLIRTLANAPAR